MPPVLTPQQVSLYEASEGNKAAPLSPLAWLAQQTPSNLSGTGQASPGAAPMANATPNAGGGTSAPASPSSTSASPAPAPSSTGNPLIDFSNALKTATEMAAQKREALGTALIMPFQGQNPSSDFNSIFANLKAAGDTTSQDLIKTATDAYTKSQPTYDTINGANGAVYQVQKDATGKIVGTPQMILPGKAATSESVDSSPSSTTQTYTLQAGDDPYNIAQTNGLDMASLQALNPNVADWHNLPVGYKLNLPLPEGELSTNPTVDSYANGILNGSITSIASVPAAYKNAVSIALNHPGKTGYSPLASSRFSMAANRIVNNYIAMPQYQLTANGLPYLQRIDAAIKNPGSVSDQDLLDSLTKLNTAGNAISDAQVKLITDGKSFSDMASTFVNKFQNGGTLSNNQRQQIVKIAQAIYDNYKSGYQPVYDQATSQLQAANIPHAFWTIPDLNKLNATASGEGQSAAGGSFNPTAARSKYNY